MGKLNNDCLTCGTPTGGVGDGTFCSKSCKRLWQVKNEVGVNQVIVKPSSKN
jgi:hypothetical protein